MPKNKKPLKDKEYVRNILYTCKSCPKSESVDNTKKQGSVIFEKINEILAKNTRIKNLDTRGVYCLNGCLNPCNISFRARNKYTMRFSKLTLEDLDDIILFARAYSSSSDGNLKDHEIPAGIQSKISVRTPPPLIK